MKPIESSDDIDVLLFYPNIYPKRGPLPRVQIDLSHTRAAHSITVEFDGDRDGWVIRTDLMKEHEGWMEVLEEAVEVAFVPAYFEGEERA